MYHNLCARENSEFTILQNPKIFVNLACLAEITTDGIFVPCFLRIFLLVGSVNETSTICGGEGLDLISARI